jgi:hypothetical protein
MDVVRIVIEGIVIGFSLAIILFVGDVIRQIQADSDL